MARQIQTIKGTVNPDSLGLILPHEHLFTDLRGPTAADYAQRDPESVVRVVAPYLADAAALGVTAMVECSTVGVGRNISILRSLSESTPVYIIAPTGVYRDAYIPDSMRQSSVDALAKLWTHELMEGIEGTSIRAGFIKLAMSDDGPTALEVRNLQAAVLTSQATGALIASHTIGGNVARKEMDVLEAAGHDLRRFVWIHAQTEPDVSVLKEAARRGAYVELDTVGAPFQSQPELLDRVVDLVEAGFLQNILLSHDAGWFDPSRHDGIPEGGYRGYTALVQDFIPALLTRGITPEQVHCITVLNPREAFAF